MRGLEALHRLARARRVVPPKVVRILGRAVAKPATSSQLLALAVSANTQSAGAAAAHLSASALSLEHRVRLGSAGCGLRTSTHLQMLDTCMRNCHPLLHYQLAQSLLWADLIKLVQDTSVTRVRGAPLLTGHHGASIHTAQPNSSKPIGTHSTGMCSRE